MNMREELETLIYRSVLSGVIKAIPTTWRAAILEVTVRRKDQKVEGYDHVISNPDGQMEPVVINTEIADATLKLAQLYYDFGQGWKRVIYDIYRQREGAWTCQVKFEF
jgi:hypothetical protein